MFIGSRREIAALQALKRGKTLVTDALLDTFPVSRYDASLAEVLTEIGRYQELGADWDGEGALAVSPDAVHTASWLVQLVALGVRQQGLCWRAPVVGPNPDGGINVEWEGEDRQSLAIIRPDEPGVVECVLDETGTPPVRHVGSIWDAMDHALWAIGGP